MVMTRKERKAAAKKAARTRKRNAAQGGSRGKKKKLKYSQHHDEILKPKDCMKLCRILAKRFKSGKGRKDEELILKKYGERFKKSGEYKFLPFPKIPNTLSEPIIIHLLRKNKKLIPELTKYEFHKGAVNGNGADISAVYNSSIKKIQAKSSGDNDFISVGKKDMKADFFIWLRFGTAYIKNNFSSLNLVITGKPNKYRKWKKWHRKNSMGLTFSQFEELAGKPIKRQVSGKPRMVKINLPNYLQ